MHHSGWVADRAAAAQPFRRDKGCSRAPQPDQNLKVKVGCCPPPQPSTNCLSHVVSPAVVDRAIGIVCRTGSRRGGGASQLRRCTGRATQRAVLQPCGALYLLIQPRGGCTWNLGLSGCSCWARAEPCALPPRPILLPAGAPS